MFRDVLPTKTYKHTKSGERSGAESMRRSGAESARRSSIQGEGNFQGEIMDVEYFTYALSAEEIKNMYLEKLNPDQRNVIEGMQGVRCVLFDLVSPFQTHTHHK